METRETITLDARAQHRLYVLNHVLTGGLSADEAARVLHLSVRQVRRLLRRYRADGSAGLVHGNRGRAPAHRVPVAIRERVVELATTTYAGVNHSHLAELLAEREDLDIAERTLRRILAAANVRPIRRPARHRSRRERMPREGQLLQIDGSRHRWFGPDHPYATLVAGTDNDATGDRDRGHLPGPGRKAAASQCPRPFRRHATHVRPRSFANTAAQATRLM